MENEPDREEIDIMRNPERFAEIEGRVAKGFKGSGVKTSPTVDDVAIRREIFHDTIGSFDLSFEGDGDFFKFLGNSERWIMTGERPDPEVTPGEGTGEPVDGPNGLDALPEPFDP